MNDFCPKHIHEEKANIIIIDLLMFFIKG
jgi:hypothetical protein